ncbi:pyruvate dehydrogenase complex dihydrolipoamide acetyltransferase [Persicirhabdus sediminis]|uniref:Acetyltransferase component of pyruvate dehydrogenase complex n=1 Tax=Persicirhabdus sediminis TaxID=454144 RepID=A0A8J7MDP3_9BACT|nr:pyruvate dehydrogenase complex dihydrolipoamide acetyltransferase [Persicirhabdus sediminis]MBK1790747.1 pyruvate dehydrogenase complex dihydrolipoamide acetyltransferase [Persicirhabdus sediminis]
MPINIEMPKLSDTMTEGTLVKWCKQVGDEIEIGDIVAEIETDKATMEMEAFDEGTLVEIVMPEGSRVVVGGVLAIMLEDGEEAGDAPAPAAAAAPASPTAAPAEPVATPSAAPTSVSPISEDGSRLRVSPLARKIAAAKGIDLATVQGSGPGGRIVKADLDGASAAPATPAPAATPAAAPVAQPAAAAPASPAIMPHVGPEDTVTPLSSMRRIIADRLLTSKTTIPHFYLHVECDAAPMMALRKQINAQAEQTHGNKYTVNDFIVKAIINSCQAVPAVNAAYNGDSIVQFANVGLSVAVAVDDGLVTPVVKNAQSKSMLEISKEIKDMAGRARENKLKPAEFDGGTITLSNLGAWGINDFNAIVNPPQAAIVSAGAIVEKPVVKDGQIVPGLRMDIGVSCDHRVVDGAVAAQFISNIKKLIENPALMLI